MTKLPHGLLDEPSSSLADDLLDRERFARSLASLIDNSPVDVSIRFGVYGEWGEGKSTVMEYVRILLKERGHYTVRYSPWEAQTLVDRY